MANHYENIRAVAVGLRKRQHSSGTPASNNPDSAGSGTGTALS